MNKKSKRIWGWVVLAIVVIAGWLLTMKPSQYQEIANFFSSTSYAGEVKACAAAYKENVDGKLIGAELNCSLEIAATFYEEDPDKAIALCMKYMPGRVVNDIGRRQNETICKFQIEDVIENGIDRSVIQVTPEPEEVSSTDIVETSQGTYTNRKYGYSFTHPSNLRVSNLDDFEPEIENSKSIYLFDEHDRMLFGINALDPDRLRSYSGFEALIEYYELPLEAFMQEAAILSDGIYDNARVGGKPGYEMIVFDNYCTPTSCRALTGVSSFFAYAENSNGVILEMEFPFGTGYEENLKTITIH